MKDYLFIYGTLLPEYAPDEIVGVVRRLQYVGPGSVRGRLYDFGQYPGAILDASSETRIQGHLFVVPDDLSVLRALDSYEGFNADDLRSSLFVRRRTRAVLGDNDELRCWVYVYNGDPGSATLIPGGDYAKIHAA